MKILIIPEDFRKDQYILKPIFERMLVNLGRGTAKVRICNPPLLQGVTEALKIDRLQEIVERYPFIDIFVLCVDRDGIVGRENRLRDIEKYFAGRNVFLACSAWEELETWALAGVDLPQEWVWKDVRADVSVKERYFDPLAIQLGVSDGPGGGRRHIGDLASRRIQTIAQKCPEDFGNLFERIEALV